jgi:hypothetical protein
VTSSPVVAGIGIFGCRDGRVYALDRVSGRRLWSFESPEGFGSSPLWLGELLVLGGYDGKVYALDARTGEPRWTVATRSHHRLPVADSTTVYIGSYDHRVYAIERARGSVKWTRDLGASVGDPAVAPGTVVAAGLDGRLQPRYLRTRRVRWTASWGSDSLVASDRESYRLVEPKTEHSSASISPPASEAGRRAERSERLPGGARRLGGGGDGIRTRDQGGDCHRSGGMAPRDRGRSPLRPAFAGDLVWITGYDGVLRGVDGAREGAHLVSGGILCTFRPALTGDTAFFSGLDGRLPWKPASDLAPPGVRRIPGRSGNWRGKAPVVPSARSGEFFGSLRGKLRLLGRKKR